VDSRRTPLDALHAESGTHWLAVDGWRVPADYGDPMAEYAALRRGAGVIDLSLRGKLHVVGPDRASFLDGMVTNHIRALRPGEGCNAAKLSIQGKMEAGLHVLCLDDALWCDIDPGPAPGVQATLARHLIMEDARLIDVTDAWALIAVQGPVANAVLQAAGVDVAALRQPLQHAAGEIAGHAVRVVRNDHTGEGGFDIWAPRDASPHVWRSLCAAEGARAAGMTALDVRRIEAGIPWYGSEITAERFPMEAGLESGWISATKGCYIGQETIARLRFQGHLNRGLRGLVFANDLPPERGATVWWGEKRAGTITSATTSPRLRHAIALALVHRDATEPGIEVEVEYGDGRHPARVTELPFV
jgi:folate-binding protein YgfZ